MKRSLSLLLCAILTASAMASCGGDAPADTSAPPASDSTAPDNTDELTGRDAVKADVPAEINYNGDTVTILTRSAEQFLKEFKAEEETGDIVNDAIYDRNLHVEDTMNVRIALIERPGGWGDHTTFMDTVRQEVFAGDNSYDVISFYAYCNPMLAVDGVYMNLYDMPYFDSEKPWWHQNYIETATVYDKLYSVVGDINLTTVTYRRGVFFNKVKAAEYLPDVNLYALVEEGKWTWDLFSTYVKDVYRDLNGNTERDMEDFYGWYLPRDSVFDFAVAGGLSNVVPDGDGAWEWDFFNEKNLAIVEAFNKLVNENGTMYNAEENHEEMLRDGHCLFYNHRLLKTEQFRDMEDDYGILPNPKFDEDQEAYYNTSGDSYSQICIPTTCRDPEMVSIFLELMSEYSYQKVTPAYFDTVLKGKYIRDDESAHMLDLIMEGAWYDFAEIHASVVGRPFDHMLMSGGADTFASRAASQKSLLETQMKDLLTKYAEEE